MVPHAVNSMRGDGGVYAQKVQAIVWGLTLCCCSVVERGSASQQQQLSYRPGRPSWSFGHRPLHIRLRLRLRRDPLICSDIRFLRRACVRCAAMWCEAEGGEKFGERERGGRPRHVRPQHGHEWQRLQDDRDQEGQCHLHFIWKHIPILWRSIRLFPKHGVKELIWEGLIIKQDWFGETID